MNDQDKELIIKIAKGLDEVKERIKLLERPSPVLSEINLFQVNFEKVLPPQEQQEAMHQFQEELRRLCYDFRVVGFNGRYRRP